MAFEQRLRTVNQEAQLIPSVVDTEQQSLVVVKKLLAIAVSTITYLRGLFPEKAYGSKYVEEQKVMILRDERSCPGAKQIVQWMHGCFDALQKKYLRMVRLSIYTDPEDPQKVTECYQFKIQYTEKGPLIDFESNSNKKVSKMSCNNTKKASILLVRKLYTLMQYLGPLPDSVCLSMTLTYYDDVTPEEYQPPGFKEGDSDSITFEKEQVKLTMGEVVTPFHTLKVDVTTERERLEQIDDGEAQCVRDRPGVKMTEEEEEILNITTTAQQSNMLNDPEMPDNEITIESSVMVSHQRRMKQCEEKLDNSLASQMESVTKNTAELEVATRRTRSGRIIKPSMEEVAGTVEPPKKKRQTKSPKNKDLSQMDFPLSQDPQPSHPKKRKYSEPKECY
ncbi:HORMA domain-containing protein 1 isoform X1 [Clupea harengus]|uniref:HORMA domain-containing protein 1 isoform X1 n=1 Tax=Clupea harengus TaxID=7950 RepID=A0A6P8GAJ7_CLUHA|nr:HORMA domain-containing protein 1 isoform X1 [Clupea harengus]XP_031432156.1 HORMA domain-containing protein 1 isoform X1 [Clupea harengus]XP_031432157.1 HORMA domain-containing protein 1 isoform X1 [Clupea harengus]